MPYRDDTEALEARRLELEQELEDIAQIRKNLDELNGREAAVRAALDELKVKSRFASAKHLPLLDRVHIASPCSAKWDDMVGDGRVRFCGHCAKNVYDLSAMTRAAAEQLIHENEGNLCVRFYRRADGTVLTADCPVGVRRKRRRRLAASAIATAAASAAAAAALVPRYSARASDSTSEVVMGGAAPSEQAAMMGTAAAIEPPAPTINPNHAKMGKVVALPRPTASSR